MIAKDDPKNGTKGITDEWGAGFYAESDDCINFTIGDNPKVYSRVIKWQDGREDLQGNLERPSLLFDKTGNPTHIFCATGEADRPYEFKNGTSIICMKLTR